MSIGRRLRILTITTLYPSEARPRHGIFVETRLRKLLDTGGVELQVVAPVPWFPFKSHSFGAYAQFARTPRSEHRNGVRVEHPRYFMLPRIGMAWQPRSLAHSAIKSARTLVQRGYEFDLIDSHYFYPDGVAAARVAEAFNKPLCITARGSDINLIATMQAPRESILRAAAQASALISVSSALRATMIHVGIPANKITVLRNGVDLERFRPIPSARDRLGICADPLILAVGNLVPEKDHALIIRALAELPDRAHLVIVGEGPSKATLAALAESIGVRSRVHFLPNRPQDELAIAYGAADVSVLASLREGWPNVVLESLACGTPVVATDVGGVREIITNPRSGRLVPERSAASLASAIRSVVDERVPRDEVRAHAARFDWESVAQDQVSLYREICRA